MQGGAGHQRWKVLIFDGGDGTSTALGEALLLASANHLLHLLALVARVVKEERLNLGIAFVLELKDTKVVRTVGSAEGGNLRQECAQMRRGR